MTSPSPPLYPPELPHEVPHEVPTWAILIIVLISITLALVLLIIVGRKALAKGRLTMRWQPADSAPGVVPGDAVGTPVNLSHSAGCLFRQGGAAGPIAAHDMEAPALLAALLPPMETADGLSPTPCSPSRTSPGLVKRANLANRTRTKRGRSPRVQLKLRREGAPPEVEAEEVLRTSTSAVTAPPDVAQDSSDELRCPTTAVELSLASTTTSTPARDSPPTATSEALPPALEDEETNKEASESLKASILACDEETVLFKSASPPSQDLPRAPGVMEGAVLMRSAWRSAAPPPSPAHMRQSPLRGPPPPPPPRRLYFPPAATDVIGMKHLASLDDEWHHHVPDPPPTPPLRNHPPPATAPPMATNTADVATSNVPATRRVGWGETLSDMVSYMSAPGLSPEPNLWHRHRCETSCEGGEGGRRGEGTVVHRHRYETSCESRFERAPSAPTLPSSVSAAVPVQWTSAHEEPSPPKLFRGVRAIQVVQVVASTELALRRTLAAARAAADEAEEKAGAEKAAAERAVAQLVAAERAIQLCRDMTYFHPSRPDLFLPNLSATLLSPPSWGDLSASHSSPPSASPLRVSVRRVALSVRRPTPD